MFNMKGENCIIIYYTYYGPNQSISVIDHFIISNFLSSAIDVYKTISSVSNISDHVPVFLDIEWHSPKPLLSLTNYLSNTNSINKYNCISLNLIFIDQILLYYIPHCYVRIFLVLFKKIIYLIWICVIIIFLMHAYLPQETI